MEVDKNIRNSKASKEKILELCQESFSEYPRGEIYNSLMAEMEKKLIENALELSFGNQITAAKILGVNRNTLHAKVKKYRIKMGKFKI